MTIAVTMRPTRRTLIAVAYGSSTVAALLHLQALWTGGSVPATPGMRLLTYTYVALVFPVAVATRRQPGARRALWIAALAAFTVSALHLTELHTGHDSVAGRAARPSRVVAAGLRDPLSGLPVCLRRPVSQACADARGAGSRRLYRDRDAGSQFSSWRRCRHCRTPRSGPGHHVVGGDGSRLPAAPWLRAGISWFVDAIVVLKRPDYRSLGATVAKRVPDLHGDVWSR